MNRAIVPFDVRGDSDNEAPVQAAMRLAPAPPDVAPHLTRGRIKPRAISWFGFSAFWGHLRHLVASAIATENIDSRQWMVPDPPDELLARMLDVLGGDRAATSLAQAKDGELWLDFIADTGDDLEVSEAVARLLFRAYEIEEDGKRLILPRGDVLMLGGDLAYPVATVGEITRRLLDPWNKVLDKVDDGKPRVLLAIPGNHDWYDGLDGFARLCQAPCAFEEESADPTHPKAHNQNLKHVLAWAEAFSRGDAVKKPKTVALRGYTPVQRVSYFRLPLADGLELWGVDRQLRNVDPRQASFFNVKTDDSHRIVVLPDPARAWGEVQEPGAKSLEQVGVVPTRDVTLVLSGDIHHYERSEEGPSLHVVSGGGGAFLHANRAAPESHLPGAYLRKAEFPGPVASRAMLWRLPWHVATGQAGMLVTGAFAIFDALAIVGHVFRQGAPVALVFSLAVAFASALLVGWRSHKIWKVVPFCLLTGIVIGWMPTILGIVVAHQEKELMGHSLPAKIVGLTIASLVAAFFSGAAFGGFLVLIARAGYNHAQPYAALGVPGYKNFVRFRITHDDSGTAVVDAFTIGVVDPLGEDNAPALVDRFTFRGAPRRRSGSAS